MMSTATPPAVHAPTIIGMIVPGGLVESPVIPKRISATLAVLDGSANISAWRLTKLEEISAKFVIDVVYTCVMVLR